VDLSKQKKIFMGRFRLDALGFLLAGISLGTRYFRHQQHRRLRAADDPAGPMYDTFLSSTCACASRIISGAKTPMLLMSEYACRARCGQQKAQQHRAGSP